MQQHNEASWTQIERLGHARASPAEWLCRRRNFCFRSHPWFLLEPARLRLNDLTAAFLLPRRHVPSCCEGEVRNISKQNSRVCTPEKGKGSAWPRHRQTFLSSKTTARRGR